MIITKTVVIKNKKGIHARVAAKIVSVTNRYDADVFFSKGDKEINGKSLLDILTLSCSHGGSIVIKISGNDASEMMNELELLIDDKFGED
ncbi:MAG: HPr family phosphocarrier protein [Deltaproteobacteria bacterium]